MDLVLGSYAGDYLGSALGKGYSSLDSSLTSGSTTEMINLYRSVGVREYYSIMQNKAFLSGGNSLECRQFAFTLNEALSYADTDLSKVTIIQTSIPKSMLYKLNIQLL